MENALTLGNVNSFGNTFETTTENNFDLKENIQIAKDKIAKILSGSWEKTKELAGQVKELAAFSGATALLILDDSLTFGEEFLPNLHFLMASGVISGAYIASNIADLAFKEKDYLKKMAIVGAGGTIGFFAIMPEFGIAPYLAGTSAGITTAKFSKKLYDKFKKRKNEGNGEKSGAEEGNFSGK